MSIRPLVRWPDPRLRKQCRPIEEIGRPELRLFQDLYDTMRAEDGVGIAAPQIGVSRMMFVIGESLLPQVTCFVNPWLPAQGFQGKWDWEYCLSFPNGTARVWRPDEVTIVAKNLQFEEFELKASGLLARCILHEYDHLLGKVLADYGLVER